mgnify:CR=1 FL=1
MKKTSFWNPHRIAFLYAFVGILWIIFSDTILFSVITDPSLFFRLQTYKGWFFVLVTAILLFGLMDSMVSRRKMIQRELQKSDTYNRLLFELSPIGLALCRMDGTFVDVNFAYVTIIGRSVEETLQMGFREITPDKYKDQDQAQLASLAKTGRYGPYEKQYIHKDGHLVDVRLRGRIIDKDGEKLIWSSVEDITEWKQAELARQSNEQVLRLFVEHTPAAIAMFDQDMKYIVASRRFTEDYQLGKQDIIGRSHYEVFPDLPDHWKEAHKRCLAGAVEKAEEEAFRRLDGNVDWIRWEIHPWYDREGVVGGIILFSEVITERKQTEMALRLSEEKFAKTFRNSPDAIALISLATGQFVEVNENFLRLSGYSQAEIIGRKPLDLGIWVDATDRERYLEVLQKAGRVVGMETEFRKKSGEILCGLISGEFIEIQDQGYLLTVIFDITERRKIELELAQHRDHLGELVQERTAELEGSRQALLNIVEDLHLKTAELEVANARLKELDRLKSMFIASMSHELRTPLNSIIGFSSIILQGMSGEINEEQRDQLGRVVRAGKHLLSLISDVIDIAKIESGRIAPFAEDFDLHVLIDEVVGQIQPQAADKGLIIREELPNQSLLLNSDRKRLMQCLLNYLSNAVKFTEKGIITVAVELQQEDWVEIRISDTGIGIGQEDQPLLFGSFVRLESHLKIGTPGTGLGLYLTKKLATEVLAGEVAAISREGEGSTFILRIPRYLQIDNNNEDPDIHERRQLTELTELEAVGTLPANSNVRDKHDTADN